MLRLSVLAIVLTLGIGPNASILCRASCTGDNLPEACHQQMASATVDGRDCCDSVVIKLSAVLSGEARQGTAAPSQEAVVAERHGVVFVGSGRLGHRDEPRGSNGNSLVTVLRI